MPACFTLCRKGSKEPVQFTTIDEELCAALGKTCDSVKWYLGWYDIIGFKLAIGKTWEQIIADLEEYDDKELLAVTRWLMEHFDSDAWYQVGKR